MADRGIIFSAPMVRALLDGRKTQTRQLFGPGWTLVNGRQWSAWARAMPWDWANAWVDPGPSPAGNPGPYLKVPIAEHADPDWGETVHRIYPATQPGDRLWVREAWRTADCLDPMSPGAIAEKALDAGYFRPWAPMLYEADGSPNLVWNDFGARPGRASPGRWRSPIHMPRWASRLALGVTEVRVQRLQEISERDAAAEGLATVTKDGSLWKWGIPDRDGLPGTDDQGWPWDQWCADPRRAYAELWNRLHGRGAWDGNPWVVAIGFTVELAAP